jgi:DNA-binding transcriptional regulator GbsR (MarR family)
MPGVIRGEGRAAEVVAFEESLLGFFIEAANLLGVPKSVAIIYGTVFASPQPLSFAEIEARLHLSKGSISQGLRLLREMGAIKEVSTPADKAELFLPDMELRKLIDRWIAERLQRQLVSGQNRLNSLMRTMPGARSADAKILRQRLKQLQNWHDKAGAALPLVRGFLKLA